MSDTNTPPAGEDVEAVGEDGATEIPEDRPPLKAIASSTPMEKAAMGVAATAIGTSVAAMVVAGSGVVYAAGALTSGIGPYAWWQQTRLTDIKALKETHEAFQQEVNVLKAENERLRKSVEELKGTIDRLEDVEEALEVITQTQGQSIETFAEQVKENREILNQMQKNLKANVLQNLLSVVIRSDTDGDNKIDADELEELVERMQNINGVQLNEDRFRAAIEDSGGSIKAVMEVVKNLLRDDVPDEEKIFVMEDD